LTLNINILPGQEAFLVDANRARHSPTRWIQAKALTVLYALLIPAHRDRTAALTEDLTRLGAAARNAAQAIA